MSEERRAELHREIAEKTDRGVEAYLIIGWLCFQGMNRPEARDFYADWLMASIS